MALWFLITHSAMPLRCEKRFDVDTKISNLKDKLYSLCGTMPMYQTILLRNNEGTCLATLDDDEACLKNYPIFEYATLHVVDSDPTNAMARLMDTSAVQRLEMTDEDYDKRENTFRTFKKTVLKDHVAAKEAERSELQKQADDRESVEVEKAQSIKVGDRCEVIGEQGMPSRRGCVAFAGKVDFQPGVWVGIKLDEPYGKNNGSVKGKQYFECFDKYGVFVKPTKVNVGDFPEIVDPDEEF